MSGHAICGCGDEILPTWLTGDGARCGICAGVDDDDSKRLQAEFNALSARLAAAERRAEEAEQREQEEAEREHRVTSRALEESNRWALEEKARAEAAESRLRECEEALRELLGTLIGEEVPDARLSAVELRARRALRSPGDPE